MRHHTFFPLLAVASISFAATVPLKFSVPPSVQGFPDGAVEWNASLACPDPLALSGAKILFSVDFDLDGIADFQDSVVLSSADCENGEAHPLKTLFPKAIGILTAVLRQGSTVSDQSSAFTGEIGGLLSIHHFCARPANGEPEWIELHNASTVSVSVAKIFFQGHALTGDLSGGLGPGSSVILGRDSTVLRTWQPTANLLTTTSWSSLRNTGDTLRLTWGTGVVLDSIIYGSDVDPREACVSTQASENASAASGFEWQIPSSRWNPDLGPLDITVQAPAAGSYDLRLYDLDGFELCAVATHKKGPSQLQLSASNCRGLAIRRGTVLLQLQPAGASPLRKILRVLGP